MPNPGVQSARRRALGAPGLSSGIALGYLSVVVLIPLAALVVKGTSGGWHHFWQVAWNPEAKAALELTLGLAVAVVAINAFTRWGVLMALLFVTLPFVVRTVQPVLIELDREMEEAAASLGAGRLTIFRRIVFPHLLPALLSGIALAFARAIGEFGAVILIAGNLPFKTEVAPLYVFQRLNSGDTEGASALALLMLVVSLLALLAIGGLRRWATRHDR